MKLTGLIAAALVARLAAQDVHVVGPSPGPGVDFTDVGSAASAAGEGDVVLVLPGSYPGVVSVIGKSLGLMGIADAGGARPVVDSLVIADLAASQSVIVRGLATPGEPGTSQIPLRVSDCDGAVLVEDCELVLIQALLSDDTRCVTLERSHRVALARSVLRGSDALITPGALPGSPGLIATDATVSLYDCDVTGGRGAAAFSFLASASAGGAGASLSAATLLVSGGAVRGGPGGAGAVVEFALCEPPGTGGAGVTGSGLLRRLDAGIAGGSGGFAPCGAPGAPGAAVALTGTVSVLPYAGKSLEITSPVEEGGDVGIVIRGQPGDGVVLLQSLAPLVQWVGGLKGALAGVPPYVVIPLGSLPAGGELSLNVTLPADLLPPGLESAHFFDQAVVGPPSGGAVLSSPSVVTLVGDLP